MSNWGGSKPMKYKDGALVPLAADRCTSGPDDGHACKHHSGHVGPHECICDREWEEVL